MIKVLTYGIFQGLYKLTWGKHFKRCLGHSNSSINSSYSPHQRSNFVSPPSQQSFKCASTAPSIPSFFLPSSPPPSYSPEKLLYYPSIKQVTSQSKNNQWLLIALEYHIALPGVTTPTSPLMPVAFSLVTAFFSPTNLFPSPAMTFACTFLILKCGPLWGNVLGKAHWNLYENPLTKTLILRIFFCFILK